MKPVTLNLASRPFRNNVLTGTMLGVVGAAIVIATVANLWVYLSYGQSYAQLQLDQAQDRARITQLEGEEKRLAGEVRARDFRRVFERGKLASELIRKSAFSWTLLFNTLETVVPPDVVMTAIRPNISAEGIIIRIEGVAKQHMALLTFEETLLRHPAFSKVFPSNERQLNPSLPDITFLLTCDYLPEHAGAPELVAKDGGAAGDTGAGGGAGAAGEAGAAGSEKAAAGAAGDNSAAAPDGAAPAAADAGAAAGTGAGPVAAPAVIAALIGRDGRPRDTRGPARTVIAPGAILLASTAPSTTKPSATRSPATAKSPAAATSQKAAGAVAGGSKADAIQAWASPHPGVSGATGGGAHSAGGSTAVGGAPAAGTTGAAAATIPGAAAAPAATPALPPAGPKVDANDPRLAAAHGPRRRLAVGPAPAQRLDIPLNFADRTVAEIYDRMGRAYAVRFDLDPIVNRQARVTINLQGRKLDDAVVLMGGMAHHRIARVSAGVYRVSPAEQGMPLGDAPVAEEPLHPGGKP